MSPNWIPNQVERMTFSLTDQAYTILKDAILSLDLPPGSPLVESELSKAIGTSVTPIREAIRRLQSDGLVTSSYGRSAYVRGFSLEDIKNTYEVRALLETYAVRKSVPIIDDEAIAKLEEIVRETEDTLKQGDLVNFSKKNGQFHRELCRCCGNNYLLSLLDDIAKQHHRIRIALAKHTYALAKTFSNNALKDHWAIINAVRSRDPDLAANLVYEDI